MLEKAIRKIPQSAIINGFRVAGLFPFNVENVDFSKCLEIDIVDESLEQNQSLQIDNIDYAAAYKAAISVLGKEKKILLYCV